MKLLTKELISAFPKLGETSNKEPENVKVIAKFFDPMGNWKWYATEFDGKDTFFGYVKGVENELGYFSLSELASLKNRFGLGIERDKFFEGHTLKAVMDEKVS